MARIRTNNVFGTVSDNPLTNVATTLNSAGLANLAAISGSDEALITLDPNRVNGAPEIVRVTAHTGSATSATIVRGRFGTAARQHAQGTEWEHAPVANATPAAGTIGDFLGIDPPACRVYHNANQSITTSGTSQILVFNSERYDTDAMHSTSVNTSRITFNTPGLYVVTASVEFAANATGERNLELLLNGTTFIALDGRRAQAAGSTYCTIETQYKFAATNYVEIRALQSSGGALNVNNFSQASPEFAATWIGTG